MKRTAGVGVLVLLAGCASGGTSGSTSTGMGVETSRSAGAATGVEGLNATLWTQHSAEYRASAEQTYLAARHIVDKGLADSSWTAALEQSGDPTRLPAGVILDVDETVLDNSPFQARLILAGREFNPEMWSAWIEEAAALPIPGALEFTRYAAERGVTVFYVTNRDAEQEGATQRNLERTGFPLAADTDVLLTRGEREGWGSDKSSRRAYVAERYRVLLLAGDDLNDFVSVERASIEERDRLETAHSSHWGRMWLMLPNPAYGSWERALYEFDGGLSPAQKRQRKTERLRTDG